MRVLVTGHDGYIGRIVSPLLGAGGHEVVGLDSRAVRGLLARPRRPRRAWAAPRPARRAAGRPGRLRRRRPPGCHLQRPAWRPEPGLHLRHQSPCVRATRTSWPSKRASTRFLFSSSCSLYGAPTGDEQLTETAPFNPVTAYGDLEGAHRAGHRRSCRRHVQPDLSAQRHGVRALAQAARRPGGERPRGIGLH